MIQHDHISRIHLVLYKRLLEHATNSARKCQAKKNLLMFVGASDRNFNEESNHKRSNSENTEEEKQKTVASVKTAIKSPESIDLTSFEETDEKNNLQEGKLRSVNQDTETISDKDGDNEGVILLTEGSVRGNDMSYSVDRGKSDTNSDTSEVAQTCIDNKIGKLVVEDNGAKDKITTNFTALFLQSIGDTQTINSNENCVTGKSSTIKTASLGDNSVNDRNNGCKEENETDDFETNCKRISNPSKINNETTCDAVPSNKAENNLATNRKEGNDFEKRSSDAGNTDPTDSEVSNNNLVQKTAINDLQRYGNNVEGKDQTNSSDLISGSENVAAEITSSGANIHRRNNKNYVKKVSHE